MKRVLGAQALKQKAKIDNKAKDVSQTKSLTKNKARHPGKLPESRAGWNISTKCSQKQNKKFGQSKFFYWNILVLELQCHPLKFHTSKVLSGRADLNQAKQGLKSGSLTSRPSAVKWPTFLLGVKSNHLSPLLLFHALNMFSLWPSLTGTFVFHPAPAEKKGRRLKANSHFIPTSTKQFSPMLILLLGWSEDKSAEIANVYKPKNFPYA